MMTLEFQTVPSPSPLRLPENYLPTAFRLFGTFNPDASFPLIPMPLVRVGEPVGDIVPVSQEALKNPSALSEIMNQHPGKFYIGPEQSPSSILQLKVSRSVVPHTFIDVPVVGIIDFGIAFWNDRFCFTSDGVRQSRFVDVGFLDFNPRNGGAPGVDFLTQACVSDITARSDAPGGEREVVDALAVKYPNSAYGQHSRAGRIFSCDGFNHGTAMADFAGGREHELVQAGDPIPPPVMFGIELPTEAVLDSSGETLQVVLNVAVLELMNRVACWAERTQTTPDLKIVISYAFLGGPDDGSHPVVESLKSVIDVHPLTPERVSLFLPTGNHLQDQLHARLNPVSKAQPREMVRWFLAPDDHGPNTVEIVMNCDRPFSLHLDHPDGRKAVAQLEKGVFAFLKDGELLIGAVWCRQLDNGQTKIRLTLGATTPLAAPMPLSASGEWLLSLSTDDGDLKDIRLWILREDGLGLTRRMAPSRQSYFRDEAYKQRDGDGNFNIVDDACPPSQIHREGTASLLATGKFMSNRPVGAQETTARGAHGKQSWYSGLFADSEKDLEYQLVDDGRPGLGSYAHGNGGPTRFRVSGTSVAAAKQARKP